MKAHLRDKAFSGVDTCTCPYTARLSGCFFEKTKQCDAKLTEIYQGQNFVKSNLSELTYVESRTDENTSGSLVGTALSEELLPSSAFRSLPSWDD